MAPSRRNLGIYGSAHIAKRRGGNPGNRSTASNLAKKDGLLGFRRGEVLELELDDSTSSVA